jgi:hypothetical protein
VYVLYDTIRIAPANFASSHGLSLDSLLFRLIESTKDKTFVPAERAPPFGGALPRTTYLRWLKISLRRLALRQQVLLVPVLLLVQPWPVQRLVRLLRPWWSQERQLGCNRW